MGPERRVSVLLGQENGGKVIKMQMKTESSQNLRPKPIGYEDVSIFAMVAGKEKSISRVIEREVLKEWVGIGWIDIRKATKRDYLNYPEVKKLK